MSEVAAASRTGDLRAMHPEGAVVVQVDGPGLELGSQKLGQPVPDSYFVVELEERGPASGAPVDTGLLRRRIRAW